MRINMLPAEYDYETAIAVQRAEEREIAFAAGSYQKALETEKIVQAAGLSKEEIEKL